jgi:hypothetical protein
MASGTLSRLSGLAWMLSGLLYIGQAIANLLRPQADVFTSTYDYAIEAAFFVALLLTLVGLLGLRKEAGRGVFPTVSFWVFLIGTLLFLISSAANLVSGRDALAFVYVPGLGLSVLGAILLGIALIRAKGLPLWSTIALMLGMPASVVLGDTFGGGIVVGLAWIAVGVALLTTLGARAKAAASVAGREASSSSELLSR